MVGFLSGIRGRDRIDLVLLRLAEPQQSQQFLGPNDSFGRGRVESNADALAGLARQFAFAAWYQIGDDNVEGHFVILGSRLRGSWFGLTPI